MIFSNAAESTVIEEAQQFGLHPRRHLTDFIQQYRATVGLLKEAFFAFRRMTEQLALNGIFWNRRAV
ncbi:hypothetical protein D3C87_2024610 [compost metagenome]